MNYEENYLRTSQKEKKAWKLTCPLLQHIRFAKLHRLWRSSSVLGIFSQPDPNETSGKTIFLSIMTTHSEPRILGSGYFHGKFKNMYVPIMIYSSEKENKCSVIIFSS